jgi:hypothetical protein
MLGKHSRHASPVKGLSTADPEAELTGWHVFGPVDRHLVPSQGILPDDVVAKIPELP